MHRRHNRWDVPRNSQNVALLGDPRNDENLIVSQLQLAFLRFHNRVARRRDGRARLRPHARRDLRARRSGVVRWHYQWIVLHEFLPKTVGESLVRDDPGRRAEALQLAQRPVHPGGVLRRRVPVRALSGPARAIARTSARAPPTRAQQFFALFSDHTLTAAPRPGRSARRVPRPAPVHRLADVLRLRRRSRPPQQAHRHEALVRPLQPPGSARRTSRTRSPRATSSAA